MRVATKARGWGLLELPGEAGLGGRWGDRAVIAGGGAAPELRRRSRRNLRLGSEEGDPVPAARPRGWDGGCGPRRRDAGGDDHGAGSRRNSTSKILLESNDSGHHKTFFSHVYTLLKCEKYS